METGNGDGDYDEDVICSCFKRHTTDETAIIETEVTQVKDAYESFLAASTPGEDPSTVVLNSLQPGSLNNVHKPAPGSLNSLHGGSLTSSQSEKKKRGHGVARTPSVSATEDCNPHHQRYTSQHSDPNNGGDKRYYDDHREREHPPVKRLGSLGETRHEHHNEEKRHSSHSDHGDHRHSDHREDHRRSSQSDRDERKNNDSDHYTDRGLRPKSEKNRSGKSPARHGSSHHEGPVSVYTQNVKAGRSSRSSTSSYHRPRSDRNSNYPRS